MLEHSDVNKCMGNRQLDFSQSEKHIKICVGTVFSGENDLLLLCVLEVVHACDYEVSVYKPN